MPGGQVSVAGGTGPDRGSLTLVVTRAVCAGSGCPALSCPPGRATPTTEIGARSPGPKTWVLSSYAPPAASAAAVTTAAALTPAGLDAPVTSPSALPPNSAEPNRSAGGARTRRFCGRA